MIKLFTFIWLFTFNNTIEANSNDQPKETSLLGFQITTGAAAGYIEDKACQTCHPKHWEGYQEVGMSQSFSKPEKKVYKENFDAQPYFHEPSQRYYKIERNKDDLFFYRYQLDDDNNKINEFRRKVDWILGSGNKSRSYLFQNASGEIYQFPLGWYSETNQWRMSPGFESANNFGLQRQVRRECMFCHNAFPQVPEGSDSHWQPHLFPKDLPHGTGCQRCHGPGAKHVKTVLDGGSIEKIHGAIVNPAKLPVEKRDSVCFQCHLLPSVAIIGSRNIERNDYSFRPGQLISDYLFHVDITDPERPKSERFEINHHAYRLRQSECFIKSEGKLTCITCHNPHQKVKPEQIISHFGAVCLNCHQPHSTDKNNPIAANDCTNCHMPQRRTQDVIEVVMTDHMIQKIAPSESERLGPIKRKDPIIESIDLLIKNPSMNSLKENIYTTIPLLRTITNPKFINHYQSLLSSSESLNPMFFMDLAKGQIDLRQYQEALKSLKIILNNDPNNLKALQLSAVAYIATKEYETAESMLNKALAINPKLADTHFNFALLNISSKKYDLAAKNLETATQLKPTLTKAWYYSGYLQSLTNQNTDAINSFKKALAIDPTYQRAYISIAESFLKIGDNQQAIRYLKHGIKVTNGTAKLDEMLAQINQSIAN